MVMVVAYLKAYEDGRLAERIRQGLERMAMCTLCPRQCKVNRAAGKLGHCRTGRHAVVASYGPHYGEERPLVGQRGSGTIFFAQCNLTCIFCQNYDISHGGEGIPVTPEELGNIMVALQREGCHNINVVTPSHNIPQILEALPHAIAKGLTVPLVYNSGGYDLASSLKLLDGIVDIYMPDFKFWDPRVAKALCDAEDYPERAREAFKEMHRQVGDLEIDARGIARRGLLVRHLVMPDGLAGTAPIFEFIARELSPHTYVNVMSQYHPCGKALGHPVLGRRIRPEEFEDALGMAAKAGLKRLDERYKHWITLEL